MITPTKELPGPRNWSFREVEKVTQENGQIGIFFFDSGRPTDGWVFDHLEDKWGFIQMADPSGKLAELLLESECDSDRKLKSTGRHYLAPAKDPEPISAEESERRWRNFTFPIIKNILPGESVLDSILSVQPMTGPVNSVISFETITSEQSRAREVAEFAHFSQALGPDELLKEYA